MALPMKKISEPTRNAVYSAIYGDIIGSQFESKDCDKKYTDDLKEEDLQYFGRFTDDTVLTIAMLESVRCNVQPFDCLMRWGKKYPHVGYGSNFKKILDGTIKPYESHSSANGCIMRAAPLLEYDITNPKDTQFVTIALFCTHNNPDSLFAFQAYSAFATSNEVILPHVWAYEALEQSRIFDMSAIGTVRDAIAVCIKSELDVRKCALNASALGGDTDTVAAIACAMAGYKDDLDPIVKEVVERKLPQEMLELLH